MTASTAQDLLVALLRRGPIRPAAVGAVCLLAVAAIAGGRVESTHLDASRRLATGFGLGIWVPLVALAVGSAVLGGWKTDGSGAHLWARPVNRGALALLSWVTAAGTTVCVAVVPLLIGVSLAGGTGEMVGGVASGAIAASVAYTALFCWLGLLTRHVIEVGLAYVLVWEGFVAKASDAAATLSIRSNALVFVERATGISLRDAAPRGSAGLVLGLCAVAGVVLTWNSVRAGALLRRV